MKHSITLKFIAFILCAFSLVSIIFSGFGIAFMQGYGLYQTPLETIQQEQLNYASTTLADYYAQWHAAESLSNAPPSLLNNIFRSYYVEHLGSEYAVEIYDSGELVYAINNVDDLTGERYAFTYSISPNYPIVAGEVYTEQDYASDITTPVIESTFPEATMPPNYDTTAETESPAEPTSDPAASVPEDWIPADSAKEASAIADTTGNDPVITAYDEALARVVGQEVLYTEEYYDSYEDEYGNWHDQVYTVNYYKGPTYEVTVHLSSQTIMDADYMLLSVLYPYRDYFIPVVLCALVVFMTTLVYLFSVAGRRSKGEVHLAAINRIPLDLYLLICGGLAVLLTAPVIWLFESAMYQLGYNIWDNPQLCLLICTLCGFGISTLIIGFLYAFAAQVKASNNYWIRHSVIGWACGIVSKALRWIGRGFGHFFRGCRAVIRMLPVIWQWLLTAFLMVFTVFVSFIGAINSYSYAQLFWLFMCLASIIGSICIVCYGAWCFGVLLKGARHMAQGNLNHQINTRFLYGCFKDFAEQLNALAGAAQVAAERQMKSERMKTELITNVSHDIKTPLTSIINYVDLMKKPHSEADREAYLDVLDRQSQRLKKLIDDLMDMSKASSGNMTVEIGQVDVVEAVNQALGEFADKLDRVNLTPVFRHPDFPVIMQADGRLVWRILSNLLNNAVKYALPDTRLYIDLMVLQGNAVLAIKNISRDQLNMDAEELMERFVRGDASRNTEGSGLGLNIAKSLVELQKGQMHLMVDGDLFKVTLIFPLV